MKKIVHITQSMERGGAEKLILDLCLASRDKYDVSVISQYNRVDSYFKETLVNNGVHLYLLDKHPGIDPANMRKIYNLLSQISPDIVHTHIQAAVYAIPWYMFHKKCVKVHTLHSIPSMEFTKAHMKMQKYAYRKLGVIPVACGETVRRETAKLYGIPLERIKLAYNGIDIARYASGEKDEHEGSVIINVANFSKWKNQQMLIDVIQYLDDTYRLVLAGEGVCREEVEEKARHNGVSHRVTFAGRSNNVPLLLSQADLFVLSSEFEGIPLSVEEAFAAGLPVVATNVGGIPDLVTDGENGFLVEAGDSREMARKIAEICSDKALYARMSAANKEKAKQFDISNTAKQYMEIYEKAGEDSAKHNSSGL